MCAAQRSQIRANIGMNSHAAMTQIILNTGTWEIKCRGFWMINTTLLCCVTSLVFVNFN
uniref:Uncharacterized protein n=1 Tax=Anguilla anguilla TaxID=7936 RepID=A0A0E9RFI9_ANGAN